MTKMNTDDAEQNVANEARLKRRHILKAGAAIAPLAVTLHGGVAFAQANSAGRCVDSLSENLMIPTFKMDDQGNYIPEGSVPFDPIPGNSYTGRNIDDEMEDHWDYVLREQIAGQTCLQSFMNSRDVR